MARQSCAPSPLRVILTRPRAQADRFAASLDLPLEIVIAPLMEIVFEAAAEIGAPDALILTSENGALALEGQKLGALPAYCVGARTTQTARDIGLIAQQVGATADELVASLIDLAPQDALLHVRGEHARGDIAKRLTAAGLTCAERVLYRQIARAWPLKLAQELENGAPVLLPLFSPRSAALFLQACPKAPRAQIICLSPAVADPLQDGRYGEIEVVPTPTGPAMTEALYRRAAAKPLEGQEASS